MLKKRLQPTSYWHYYNRYDKSCKYVFPNFSAQKSVYFFVEYVKLTISAEKSTVPCLKSHILFPVFVSPTVIDFYIFIT